MWRDRTNLYISYRQSYSHHPAKRPRFIDTPSTFGDDDRRGLLSPSSRHSDDAIIEMDLLPPRWADVTDEVNELLTGIARKSTLLERLHNKHVLPGFDDSCRDEGEIERLTAEITGDFHACQRKISSVKAMLQGATSAEDVMGRNLQMSLAARVQESSTLFRKKQSAYLRKLRGISTMTERSSSPGLYNPAMEDPAADVSYSQSALQRSAQLTSNDAAIMQREREITDIAKGIIELADIFKELQSMVIDQGTMLDRIDYNVEMLNVNVKEADKEMTVASGYQRKTTKRKIMFLLFLIILGLVILLVIKPKKSSPPAAPAPAPVAPQKDLPLVYIRGRKAVW